MLLLRKLVTNSIELLLLLLLLRELVLFRLGAGLLCSGR
jgi:hypothetical protein